MKRREFMKISGLGILGMAAGSSIIGCSGDKKDTHSTIPTIFVNLPETRISLPAI